MHVTYRLNSTITNNPGDTAVLLIDSKHHLSCELGDTVVIRLCRGSVVSAEIEGPAAQPKPGTPAIGTKPKPKRKTSE